MESNSITITYRNRQITLDRVNVEGKYFQLGFESDKWSVRIYRLKKEYFRIVIEKMVRRSDDGTSTQFMWDCYCVPSSEWLCPTLVCSPVTGKSISKRTKWVTIDPMLQEIYALLKDEMNSLPLFKI